MKLQPDKSSTLTISGYGPGWIGIDGQKFSTSVLLSSNGQRCAWDCDNFAQLNAVHFEKIAPFATENQAELVIFGSGKRMRFPRIEWLQGLVALQLGIETMSTDAACRTYNILAAEGRRVVCALIIEAEAA